MTTTLTTERKLNATEKWLAQNRRKFGSHDGLPGEFHREVLFRQIKPQNLVGLITPHGNILQGRVVMRGPAGWVVNVGGAYGTPKIIDARNCIYVQGATLT